MAYLNLKDWKKAEQDATSAIQLDRFHWKSYQRRSVALCSLGKIRASINDLETAKRILAGDTNNGGTPPGGKGIKPAPPFTRKSTSAALKKIEKDLEKNRALLLEAIKKAPKKTIPIQVISNYDVHETASLSVPVAQEEVETKKDGSWVHVTEKDLDVAPTVLNQDLVVPTTTNLPAADAPKTYNLQNILSRFRSGSTNRHQPICNWMEFEQIWKSLSQEDKPVCLGAIKPKNISTIYSNGIEDSDVLVDLISTLFHSCNTGSSNGTSTTNASKQQVMMHERKLLQALSEIPAVDMVVMMMSSSEREVLLRCIECLTTGTSPENDKGFKKLLSRDQISKKFGL